MTRVRCWFTAGSLVCTSIACSGEPSVVAPTVVTLSDPASITVQAQTVQAAFSNPMYFNYALMASHFSDPIFPSGGPERNWAVPRGPARIPPDLLGTTYVWDADSGGYVASSLTGAPPNGIRFMLYTLAPLEPALPLDPLGYVDFTDQGSGSALVIGLTVVGTTGATAVTYVDLTIIGTHGVADSIEGYLSDGHTRVDIATARRSGVPGLLSSDDARFDIPTAGVRMRFKRSTTLMSGGMDTVAITYNYDYSVMIGNQTLAERGSSTALVSGGTGTIIGAVLATVNEAAFATLTHVPSGGLVVTRPTGQPLSAADETALRAVYTAPNYAFFELLSFLSLANTMAWRGL